VYKKQLVLKKKLNGLLLYSGKLIHSLSPVSLQVTQMYYYYHHHHHRHYYSKCESYKKTDQNSVKTTPID